MSKCFSQSPYGDFSISILPLRNEPCLACHMPKCGTAIILFNIEAN